ncbi:Ig-like domain-containing protein [Treponema putidum]|uniref:Ig-like domain-containing protein n=1 Tax=Treponema putidum TaxID=221027 RepID=UPI003D8B5461
MKITNYAKRILPGAALFMLFIGLFTGCPQKVEDKKVSVEGVTLDKTELNLGVGESTKLTATINPANASNKTITWDSDKPDIAEVDQDGTVRGKAEGKAVIRATTQDGNKTATCNIKVEKGAILYLSPDKKEITIYDKTLNSGDITVAGCEENEPLSSGVQTTLTATGDRVILKGDITELYCTDNKLTGLNAQGLNNLKMLVCNNNQLTKLHVQGLNNLTMLECGKNQLKELNAQGLNNLTDLWCNDNQLTELNAQVLTNLKELWCYNNQLDKAAFTQLFNDLPKKKTNEDAQCVLYADISGITEGNYTDFTPDELQVIKNKKWKPLKQIGHQFYETAAI